MDKKLAYTIREAAELLTVSPSMVRKMLKTGDLLSVRIGTRHVVTHKAIMERLGLPPQEE